MNATRTAALAAIAAGLATTACATGRQPATVITVAPAAPATTPPAEAAEEVPFVLDPGSDELVEDEPIDDTDAIDIADDDPPGTVVQIAVRYLNALRAGRWYDAVNDMAYFDRKLLDPDDAPSIGREVLRNARGNRTTLPRCTSGERFTADAVVARCGNTNVIVHVKTLTGFRGVDVSEWHVGHDHLARPHTHAYSTRV